MNVLSELRRLGFKMDSDLSQFECTVFNSECSSTPKVLLDQRAPLVSCLMMTRGNIELMKHSLACYQRQTYANRELVVVAEAEAGERVRAFIASQHGLNVVVFVAPPGLSIGDHRNLAAARARGAILVNWDDDDLSDPRRLDAMVAVLQQTGAAAAFLSRLLIWWPERKIAGISKRRFWEQSIAAWRNYMPIYAPLPRGGDTVAINSLISTHRSARFECPLMYVYAVTGRNIWGVAHFQGLLSHAECIFEGKQFSELNELLSDRLPVLEYAAMLTGPSSA